MPHTPRPWHIGMGAIVTGTLEIGDDATGTRLAELNAHCYQRLGEGYVAQMMANAKLFRAAPDMYALLKDCLVSVNMPVEMFQKINDVLDKVEGKF